MEELEISFTDGGNIKEFKHFGKQFSVSLRGIHTPST